MNDIENHVVGIELAKELREKLKSVGAKIEFSGYFYWCYDYAPFSNDDCPTEHEHLLMSTLNYGSYLEAFNGQEGVTHHERNSYFVPAPLLTELIFGIAPKKLRHNRRDYYLCLDFVGDLFDTTYTYHGINTGGCSRDFFEQNDINYEGFGFNYKTEKAINTASLLAKLLIWLIDNKYWPNTKLQEVKNKCPQK